MRTCQSEALKLRPSTESLWARIPTPDSFPEGEGASSPSLFSPFRPGKRGPED
jgi:hypothetical protein